MVICVVFFSCKQKTMKLQKKHGDLVKHRGPDASGHLIIPGESSGYMLCFHRLAIIETSGTTGMQPIQEGDITLLCNGEIYNYEWFDRPKEKFSDGTGFSYVPDLLRKLSLKKDDGTLSCRLAAEKKQYKDIFEEIYNEPAGRWVIERKVPEWVEPTMKDATSSSSGMKLSNDECTHIMHSIFYSLPSEHDHSSLTSNRNLTGLLLPTIRMPTLSLWRCDCTLRNSFLLCSIFTLVVLSSCDR